MKKYPKIISHVRIKNDQVRLTYFNDFFSSSYNHNFVQVILTKSHMKPKKLTFFLASFLLIFTSCEKPRNWQDEYEPQPVFRIGVLLSLSGSGASTGQSTKVSIDLARQDITALAAATDFRSVSPTPKPIQPKRLSRQGTFITRGSG
jgi:uncharacterized lipoprotein YajG